MFLKKVIKFKQFINYNNMRRKQTQKEHNTLNLKGNNKYDLIEL